MPITMAELEKLTTEKPAGTPLAEILGVGNIYWSDSLTQYIYLLPNVIGKPSAIVPAALKAQYGGEPPAN